MTGSNVRYERVLKAWTCSQDIHVADLGEDEDGEGEACHIGHLLNLNLKFGLFKVQSCGKGNF